MRALRGTKLRACALALSLELLAASLCAACAPTEEAPLPDAPTVLALESPTTARIQVLRGTKPASTGIEINGLLALPLDESTQWQVEVALLAGLNSYRILAVDALGQRSHTVAASAVLDLDAPTTPDVDVPDYATLHETWTLTGEGEEGADILVNGALAERGPGGAFEIELPLSPGDNAVRVTAVDGLGNESAPAELTLTRTTFSFTIEPPPALVSSEVLTLAGERAPGVDVEVDGVLRLPRDALGGRWTLDVPLAAGDNQITVRGFHPEGAEHSEILLVHSDTSPPSPPVLEPLADDLITGAEVLLSGTREPDTAVVVNGVVRVPLGSASAFSTTVPLALGLNTLDVRARDAAGNESPAAAPAPVVYRDPNGIYLSVDPLPARVASAALTLSGAKAGNASLHIGGEMVASADGSTTWSHPLTLTAGSNTLVVEARVGTVKRALSVLVEYLPDGPEPVVVTLPAYVNDAAFSVDGSKPAGTGVVREDGSPVAVLDEGTSFHDELTLAPGANALSWRTRDAFGRLGPAAGGTVTLDQLGPVVSVDQPAEGEVVGALFDVMGSVSDDFAVAGVEVCLGDECATTGSWQAATTGSGGFSALVSTLALPAEDDGSLVALHVRALDAAGNVTLLPARELMLVREPLAAGADAAFAEAREDLDLAVGPARELYVAFHHPSAHGGDVYLLLEDGVSFSGLAPELLSGADYGASKAPRVVVDAAGVAHVVWLADGTLGSASPGSPGVVYRSVDGGALSVPEVLQATGACDDVELAVSPSGLLAVAWRRALTTTTFAIELVIHDGDAFGAALTVAADGDGTSVAPALPALAFSDDDTLHVVWQDAGSVDGSADDLDVLHRSWTAASGLAPVTTLVSGAGGELSDGSSRAPRVAAVPGSAAHEVWIGWIEDGAIATLGAGVDKAAVRRLDDDSMSVVRDASTVPGAAAASELDLAVSESGELVVTFVDTGDIGGSGSDSDVFLRAHPGAFQPVVSVSDRHQDVSSTGESRRPRVAIDAVGNAHVIWLEASDLTGSSAGPGDVDVLYFAFGEHQR